MKPKTLKGASRALAVVKPPKPKQEPSVAQMLQAVVDRGITAANVGTVEKMISLYERMQERESELKFAAAFNRLATAIPAIKATRPVPSKDGTVRYKYEPLFKIERKLRPLALKFGFTYTFSEGLPVEGKVTKVCTVQHTAGWKRSNAFTVNCGSVPHGTPGQNSMSDHSYAKRGVLCDAFGITVDHEDDARMEGKPISQKEADELRQLVRENGIDEARFLKFAGAEKYTDILDSHLDVIKEALDKKIRDVKAKPPAPAAKTEGGAAPESGEFRFV